MLLSAPKIARRAFFSRGLLAWYRRHRRDLPWRQVPGGEPVQPWRVLVSEFMLQQTQVATVIPYFRRFMQRFPTPESLAKAPQRQVLRLWQGLGYYRRARNLRSCAQTIVRRFGGRVPGSVSQLMELPGVGRYTAGAVASIAFGRCEPVLDGNVMRILCRLESIGGDPRSAAVQRRLWDLAESLLPRAGAGDHNCALMDLGATVCTPRRPRCEACPVRGHCRAFAACTQHRLPASRRRRALPLARRWTFCIRCGNHWLIERRPASGRWGGLWQFVTIAADAPTVPPDDELAHRLGMGVRHVRPLGVIEHTLSHRRYRFEVHQCSSDRRLRRIAGGAGQAWVALRRLDAYPLPKPHLRIAQMAADAGKPQRGPV